MSGGVTRKGAMVGSVIGPGHGPLWPSVFYGAWLDDTGAVIAMTGQTVPHAAFEVIDDASVNTAVIDGGVCPATVPARFGLMDTPAGDNVELWAPVTFADAEGTPVVPDEGDPLSFAPGALEFVGADVEV